MQGFTRPRHSPASPGCSAGVQHHQPSLGPRRARPGPARRALGTAEMGPGATRPRPHSPLRGGSAAGPSTVSQGSGTNPGPAPRSASGRGCHWLWRGALTASRLQTISCCCGVNAKQTFLSLPSLQPKCSGLLPPLTFPPRSGAACHPGEYQPHWPPGTSTGLGAAGDHGVDRTPGPEGPPAPCVRPAPMATAGCRSSTPSPARGTLVLCPGTRGAVPGDKGFEGAGLGAWGCRAQGLGTQRLRMQG